MTYSIIHLSQLEGAHRLDAEYYQPEYLQLASRVFASESYKRWGEIGGRFISGPFGSEFNVENYDPNSKCRYIRGKDVKEFFLKDDDNVYVPEKDFERLKKYALAAGDILISVVGTPGTVAIVDESVPPAIFSCKSTAFQTNAINSYYLIAYLNARYGNKLLERSVRGALQTGLNIDDLKSLPIFVPSVSDQDKIAAIVLSAKKAVDDAKALYVQAEQLLLRELGLDEPEQSEPISWVVQFSDIRTAERCDAEYFQPKYDSLLTDLQKHPHAQLGDLVELLGHATQSEYVEDGDIAVLAQKHMENGLVIDTGTFDHSTNDAEIQSNDRQYILKRDDVLVSSAGEPGKTCVWNEPYERKVIPGSFVTVIRTSQIDPFYLGVFLNSPAGKMQFQKLSAASVQQYVYPRQMRSIVIPLLSKRIQEKIQDFIQQSHTARTRAKQLFEEAKRKVETLIESSS